METQYTNFSGKEKFLKKYHTHSGGTNSLNNIFILFKQYFTDELINLVVLYTNLKVDCQREN